MDPLRLQRGIDQRARYLSQDAELEQAYQDAIAEGASPEEAFNAAAMLASGSYTALTGLLMDLLALSLQQLAADA
mgnify:CR=1 FL=1